MNEIPVIDFHPFVVPATTRLTEKQRLFVAKQVRNACEHVGFFYATGLVAKTADNHRRELFNRAIASLQQFFDNETMKEQCASHKSPLFCGYTRCGGGNNCVPDADNPELKESFTVGAEGNASPMHGANLWPEHHHDDECSIGGDPLAVDFQQDLMGCFEELLRSSRILAQALAVSLDLEPSFFTDRMRNPAAQLVGFKYPPEQGNQTSCGEHTDCGFLTLLVQSCAGLEVCTTESGQWQSAPPIEGAILVNLGDLTQFWTQNRYKSTLHRVHNQTLETRYSLVFFANCDFDARIDNLNESSSGAVDVRDSTVMTAGQYIMEKLGLMWMMDKDPSKS